MVVVDGRHGPHAQQPVCLRVPSHECGQRGGLWGRGRLPGGPRGGGGGVGQAQEVAVEGFEDVLGLRQLLHGSLRDTLVAEWPGLVPPSVSPRIYYQNIAPEEGEGGGGGVNLAATGSTTTGHNKAFLYTFVL